MIKHAALRILWVDDDIDLFNTANWTHGKVHHLTPAFSVDEAKKHLVRESFDVVVVDLNFEGQEADGLELLSWIDDRSIDAQPIILSGDTNTRRVSSAARRPKIDFVVKSPNCDEELSMLFERVASRKAKPSDQVYFESESPLVKALLRDVSRICSSHTKSSILILGETGAGKEQLAREIAQKMGKRLIAVNMATVSKERAESELFGHRKGAFTGAIKDEPGLLRQAHGELFFMDEIGECSPEVQSKLLRVLQEKEVTPVGGTAPSKIDLQFISATHQPLESLIESGRFRLDLLQRINTFVLRIPPLRERPEDIKVLLFKFIEELSNGDERFQISPDAVEVLIQHPWPGNVRELKSVVERCVVMSASRTIDAELVLRSIGVGRTESHKPGMRESRDIAERSKILAVIESVQGNRELAARKLGVSERHIYRMIKKHHIPLFASMEHSK